MHHYPFHVGDYASHTQHLDDLEDLAYRRMLDYVYLNEINLPESVDEIARLIRMRTHCERIATVLREFFTLENGEWINKRSMIEIAKYHAKSDKAKESASKRWKKDYANALPTHSERNANQNQNQNQEPIDKTPSSSGDYKPEKKQPDYQAIIDLYHRILPSLPMVKLLTDKRKASIRSCCSLKPSYIGLDFWDAYFEQASKSDFIMGRKTDWRADFDFLVTKSKFVKVLEGSYD
jgi:uncharacterized protein YdaU (DUF1376 family)